MRGNPPLYNILGPPLLIGTSTKRNRHKAKRFILRARFCVNVVHHLDCILTFKSIFSASEAPHFANLTLKLASREWMMNGGSEIEE